MNLEAENPEEWQKEEQERIDTAEPLSEEQQQEKESLLQQVRLYPSPAWCSVHWPLLTRVGNCGVLLAYTFYMCFPGLL